MVSCLLLISTCWPRSVVLSEVLKSLPFSQTTTDLNISNKRDNYILRDSKLREYSEAKI